MLEVLSNAVDELVSDIDDYVDDATLDLSIVDVQHQIDRLSAIQAQQLAQWDAKKLWTDDGSRSAAHRLARQTGLSISDAKLLMSRSRRLCSMPHTLEAFLSGSMSSSRVNLLISINKPWLSSLFAQHEQMLVDMATSLSFLDASRALRYWANCADEDRAEDKAKKQTQARSASIAKTFEGNVDLRAWIDPIGGEILSNELSRLEDELFNQDWALAKAVHGDQVTADRLIRTHPQRRCDALVEMAKRSASSQGPTQRPLISVVLGNESFSKVCELSSGTIITPGQVAPLLGEADIERIVFDGPKRVIDVSHKRNFSGALRRAIEIRDRHCQHLSGCDVPATRCDVDHLVAYARGGATNQTNGRLLCPTHNRAKGSGPP